MNALVIEMLSVRPVVVAAGSAVPRAQYFRPYPKAGIKGSVDL